MSMSTLSGRSIAFLLWLECRNGMVAKPGGRCLPCEANWYGHKCVTRCKCYLSERCDAVVGCILKTIVSNAGTSFVESTPTTILTTSVLITTKETTFRNSGLGIGEWSVYSLFLVSILSAILIGLLCVLFCKHRNSHYNPSDSGIHNSSESVEVDDTPHVYNIIYENNMDAYIPHNDIDFEIESEGTHNSNRSDNNLLQYEENEYLHPYHSLVTVTNTERHDYEQISVQSKDHVYTGQGTDKISNPVHPVTDNRTLSYYDCSSGELRQADGNTVYDSTENKACISICSSKHKDRSDINDKVVSVTANMSNVIVKTPNLNQFDDNISLD